MNDAILVTGARGFVGKNLVQWLMQELSLIHIYGDHRADCRFCPGVPPD